MDDEPEILALFPAVEFSREQALELCEEVGKLLRAGSEFKEDFDADETPAPPVKRNVSVVESWFAAPQAQVGAWGKCSLQLSGCLVERAAVEIKFASHKRFSTQLAREPTGGWVLEQLLTARKETESACRALRRLTTAGADLRPLCDCLDVAISGLIRAQNAFLLPNPLGFPRALRPFNGFSTPIAPDYLLEFSVFRDRLFVSAFRVAMVAPTTTSPTAVASCCAVPDVWFDEPLTSLTSRWKDMIVTFEGGQTIRVLEYHHVSFPVAQFTKILVFLGDAQRVLSDLRYNVVACLQAFVPGYYVNAFLDDDDDDDDDRGSLIQPWAKDGRRRCPL
jgi:hypothetical protein